MSEALAFMVGFFAVVWAVTVVGLLTWLLDLLGLIGPRYDSGIKLYEHMSLMVAAVHLFFVLCYGVGTVLT